MSKQSDIVKVSQDAGSTGFVNTTGDTMTGTLNVSGVDRNTDAVIIGANAAETGYGLRIGASGATDPLEIWREHSNGNQMQMSVDYYGRVTMPYQPSWLGTVGNQDANGICATATVKSSYGLTFSNSRITVPVAGTYLITFTTITTAGSGRIDTDIRVNGSQICNGLNNGSDNGGSADYRHRTMVTSHRMQANDYIQFRHEYPYASGSYFDPWQTASVTLLG